MKIRILSSSLLLALSSLLGATEYLTLVEKSCAADPAWQKVGDELAKKHAGACAPWDGTEAGLLRILKERTPRYLAIVAKPDTFYAATVRGINRATRSVIADDFLLIRKLTLKKGESIECEITGA